MLSFHATCKNVLALDAYIAIKNKSEATRVFLKIESAVDVCRCILETCELEQIAMTTFISTRQGIDDQKI